MDSIYSHLLVFPISFRSRSRQCIWNWTFVSFIGRSSRCFVLCMNATNYHKWHRRICNKIRKYLIKIITLISKLINLDVDFDQQEKQVICIQLDHIYVPRNYKKLQWTNWAFYENYNEFDLRTTLFPFYSFCSIITIL